MAKNIICDKKAYKSYQEADRTRFGAYLHRKRKLRIYQCPDCHKWHLSKVINYENPNKTKFRVEVKKIRYFQ